MSNLVTRRAKYAPVGSHQNKTAVSVQTLTPDPGATGVFIQATTQNLRMTLDGTTPTAAIGFQLATTQPPLYVPVPDGASIKVIQETSGGIVQFQWVREI